MSGVGPGEVLDRPHVQQVAGDRSGGFYRPRPGYPDTRGPGGVVLEAYRWSELASGTATRTLSLVFLLPFMLSNVAIWMHPAGRGSGAGVKVLCRLLALSLTLLYVLSVVGVALDLIAWECMASARCLAGRNWVSWLGGRPVELRLAVLALVPVAAIGLVWLLGARPGRSYAAFRAPTGEPEVINLSLVGRDALPMVRRLRAVHVAAAFAMLDLTLLAARAATGPSAVTIALLTLAAAVLVACAVMVGAPALVEGGANLATDRAASALRAAGCGLTVLTLGVVVLDPTPWPRTDGLPGYDEIVAWVFVMQTAVLAALGLLVLRQRGGRERRPTLLRGMGAPAIAAGAVGLAVVFSADLVYRMAYFLNRRPPAQRPGDLAAPPLAYKWAIFVFFLVVMVAAVVGGAQTLLSGPARRRAAAAIVAGDFPAAPPQAADRVRRVRKVIARARFTERLGPAAIALTASASTLGLAASALALAGRPPAPLMEHLFGVPSEFVNFGLTTGSYLIVGIVAALVIGGLFAYRTPEFRRYVGVLWDLGTFWPRTAHPFAPPCYAERAVPELTKRICYLADHYRGVLLTGHSHGSVLLAATVLQLPPQVRQRIALLTYGSPLNRLYAQLFPAFLGEDMLREVGDRIGWRWVNLWRDTDPIGGWVFAPNRPGERPVAGPAGSVDRRLRDPEDVVPPASDSVPPPIKGHWPCESDERIAAAACELVDRLRDPRR
ncbi:hypothetical protein [Micromonospora rhizosphaerae]|uniref:hypothetical protein n=1 Tax=Micromonospora rhizosphaerae TaxID=568872 RepID=UPI001FE0D815|nr:hypothetical protein [Micromonospora rhizosphaerae]